MVCILLLSGMLSTWHSRHERWHVAVAEADASARTRAILDSTSDAIVILNPSGTIENVNAAARSVLGYEPAELSRRDLSVLLD
ncbi:MAG: PAS domain-containing protein, partial [Alphaproteobacteria bacterium]